MAYISTERVAEIRKELKTKYPFFKFSITCQDNSAVQISILEAPVALTSKAYQQVNVYHYNRSFEGYALEVVADIISIAQSGTKYYETGDYGRQPSHYVYLNIGEWNKPFKMILLNDKSQKIGAITFKAKA